jgi:hypothetical protein
MWFFKSSRTSSARTPARDVPAPPVEAKPFKLTGIVVRRERLSIRGYQSSGDRLYLAIRLHEGEGIGTNKDTVLFSIEASALQPGQAAVALLEKGDQVTVQLEKNEDGELVVLDVIADPSQFSTIAKVQN